MDSAGIEGLVDGVGWCGLEGRVRGGREVWNQSIKFSPVLLASCVKWPLNEWSLSVIPWCNLSTKLVRVSAVAGALLEVPISAILFILCRDPKGNKITKGDTGKRREIQKKLNYNIQHDTVGESM